MTNLIQNASITESINAFINALNARTPAVYRIIAWKMPQDELYGSITLTGSRLFKNLEVSQMITFKGLKNRHFRRFSVEHIALSQKEVTLEYTDQNTFKLTADKCVFFEGNAIEAQTGNRNFRWEGDEAYCSYSAS